MDQQNEEIPILVGFEGEMDGRRWMLHDSLILGRDPNCDIAIQDRQVSRNHAKITKTEDGVFLEDLVSKNGTHRNGLRVNNIEKLADNDVIHIALAQKFIFMSADATLPLGDEGLLTSLQLIEGRLRLEKKSRRVWIAEKEVVPPLSVSQFRLLEILYKYTGQLVSRNKVMASVWGEENAYSISEQALDALVRRLRDRLASVDPEFAYVVTVRGHGLRLENPPK